MNSKKKWQQKFTNKSSKTLIPSKNISLQPPMFVELHWLLGQPDNFWEANTVSSTLAIALDPVATVSMSKMIRRAPSPFQFYSKSQEKFSANDYEPDLTSTCIELSKSKKRATTFSWKTKRLLDAEMALHTSFVRECRENIFNEYIWESAQKNVRHPVRSSQSVGGIDSLPLDFCWKSFKVTFSALKIPTIWTPLLAALVEKSFNITTFDKAAIFCGDHFTKADIRSWHALH